ncbi:PREDICTED: gamma-aminobutyric acid type B receptor subunit 1-like [Priapulus caudatus]|uniref:Gamma-aminobutyric acid type B receptor subunit 1-like n=1 Tax=Priapulus caudatus TaxID=37621 RepID=A0ABM1F089_PRICU|nr:PREDICTED: gamma-aminobutyric acid type B receptor subunit 1-like [Priapulus caudatus]
MKRYVDEVISSPIKQMLFISGCSKLAEPMVVVQSPAISNKEKHPYTFRNDISDGAAMEPKVALMKHYKWKKVAFIAELVPIFTLALRTMANLMEEEGGFDILAWETFESDPTFAVQLLKKVDARIIVAHCYQETARKVFCEAYKLGLYGPKYVWFLVGWYNSEWWMTPDSSINCTSSQLGRVAENYISTQGLAVDPISHQTINGMTVKETIAAYDEYVNYNDTLGAKGDWPLTYDSMWAMAIAFHNTSQYLKRQNSSKGIESFTYESADLRQLYMHYLGNISFNGVSAIPSIRIMVCDPQ